MTRERAIEILEEEEDEAIGSWASRTVDLYVRLGMLKLDEPKSAEDRFIELSINQGRSEGFATNVLQILELAGLKIVSK